MNCSNCKKDIECNFELHVLNCRKNNIFCEKCREVIPKSSFLDHFELKHEEKTCEFCGKIWEAQYFGSHPCSDPQKTCEYCEVVLKKSLLDEHIIDCQNRTQECSKCLKLIKNKDFFSHSSSCKGAIQAPAISWEEGKQENFDLQFGDNSYSKSIQSESSLEMFEKDISESSLSENTKKQLIDIEKIPVYKDDGAIHYKSKITIFRGPRFSVINGVKIKPEGKEYIFKSNNKEESKSNLK